jgi:hypothetical protein
MRYRVRLETVLEFDDGKCLERANPDPKAHDSDIADLLKQGKRCFKLYVAYGNILADSSPVDLKVGDVIYGINGDSWEDVVGEVASVEEIVD